MDNTDPVEANTVQGQGAEEFIKQFGPMHITTGYGWAIAEWEQKQAERWEAWKAGVDWNRRTQWSEGERTIYEQAIGRVRANGGDQ